MKCLGRVLLFTISILLPIQANADDWNKYIQILDRFYKLDKQKFNTISCNIEMPLTTNQVKQVHAQIDSMKDKIELTENLEDFNLTYNNNGELNINRPSLEMKIISENGMADPARVKNGIEMVNSGFKKQIEGAVMQLQALFGEFENPKKDQLKIIEIKEDKRTSTITYEKKGGTVTETYSQNQRKIQQKSANGDEMSSIQSYKKIAGNKLLFTDAQILMNNAMSSMEMKMTISYEKVKDVLFPTHIESLFKQTMLTIKQEGQIDIYLKNCTLR